MRIFQSRPARPTAFGLLLAVFACHDSTAPATPAGPGSGVSALIVPIGGVRVFPDSMRGWMFFDDQHGAACLEADNCHIARDTSRAQFGATSIALATPSGADADVLMLPAFRGTRLDRITELRYSTLRESNDATGQLAAMLQLNVDYDLTDSYSAYEGRIVFEPAQGHDGVVPQNTWQRWDARSGTWWGTKTVVRRGGAEAQNMCTRAAPCTWAKLITTYPDIGIHATNGAVVLQAGPKWAGFRGNVDSVTIAVEGAATTYDFDTRAPVAALVHLYARIGAGVAGTRLPDDSTYTPGAVVAYQFTPTPGHDRPYVLVDDTLAAVTGVVVMDGTHSIEVASDTSYALAGLSNDGREIASRLRTLVTTRDKVEAYADLMTFFNTRLDAGADGSALAAEFEVASRLVISPVRDSAALRVVDEALIGYVFTSTLSTPFVEFSRVDQVGPRTSSRGPAIQRSDALLAPPNGPLRAQNYPDQLESPKEPTVIVYVNGINTLRYEAALTTGNLRELVRGQPRFANGFTRVDHIYNSTGSPGLEAYDRAHPCEQIAANELSIFEALAVLARYSLCGNARGIRYAVDDLQASFQERLQLLLGAQATGPEPGLITKYVDSHRTHADDPEHIIVVGHSEGTILLPLALRELPAIENHPLNDARACLATLSLAGAANRSAYALDEPFKSGFIVEDDIITLVTTNPGWTMLHTDATEAARRRIAGANVFGLTRFFARLVELKERFALHSVDKVYLGDPGARSEIVKDLTALHKECTQGDLTVTPTDVTAEVGTTFKVTPKLINQNGNELFGRWMSYQGDAPVDSVARNTFLVIGASDRATNLIPYTGVVYDKVRLTVPPIALIGTSIFETYYTGWEVYAESNGGLGDRPYGFEDVVPPDDPWDGSDGSCAKYFIAYGRTGPGGPSYRKWVRTCGRAYTVVPGRSSNEFLAPKVIGYNITWHYANGGIGTPGHQMSVGCSSTERCISGVEVVAYTATSLAGASGFVAAAGGGSGVSSARVSAAARAGADRASAAAARGTVTRTRSNPPPSRP